MNLSRLGKEYYELAITTTPATQPTDWSASFDGGTTWTVAIAVNGNSAWLVAGSHCTDTSGAAAVLAANVTPLVRLTANPEIIVRDAPDVTLS